MNAGIGCRFCRDSGFAHDSIVQVRGAGMGMAARESVARQGMGWLRTKAVKCSHEYE
jgi:hypothetical protein